MNHSSVRGGRHADRSLRGGRSVQWLPHRSGAELDSPSPIPELSFTSRCYTAPAPTPAEAQIFNPVCLWGFLHWVYWCSSGGRTALGPAWLSMVNFLSSWLVPWLWIVLDSGADLDLGVLSLSRASCSL